MKMPVSFLLISMLMITQQWKNRNNCFPWHFGLGVFSDYKIIVFQKNGYRTGPSSCPSGHGLFFLFKWNSGRILIWGINLVRLSSTSHGRVVGMYHSYCNCQLFYSIRIHNSVLGPFLRSLNCYVWDGIVASVTKKFLLSRL